jgi:lysophospholipase L1-like esterase
VRCSLALLGLSFMVSALGCADSKPFARGQPPALSTRASMPPLNPAGALDADAGSTQSVLSAEVAAAPAFKPSLEHPEALKRFFDALGKLEDGGAQEDVRVMQFGDSHTAADIGTSAVRRALQARFGDGGRGFIAAGRPWATYLQEGFRGGMTREWAGEHGKLKLGQFVGDGRYGLAGYAIQTTRKGARAWTDATAAASKIEVAYLEQPGGGSFEVLVDGARSGKVSTKSKTAQSGYRSFDVADGPHHVELKAVGDGPLRVFGLVLDRTKPGVVFETLGINGARATQILQWDEAHMNEQIRHHPPDLVVYAYGTNEVGDDTPIATYERQLVDVLGRMARAVPSASCLLLGPPDRAHKTPAGWVTAARLLEIVEAQRKVAEAAGCAFYSQLDAMGGPGTMAAWADEPEPRGRKDHVHLTREGYTQLGQALATDVLRAYTTWHGDSRPPAVARR